MTETRAHRRVTRLRELEARSLRDAARAHLQLLLSGAPGVRKSVVVRSLDDDKVRR